MPEKLLFIFLIFSMLAVELSAQSHAKKESNKSDIHFGDPFVLLDHDDTYYMYGTSGSDTGIKVYQSSNLKEWQGPVGSSDGFALHKDDVVGGHSFWAPEVYHLNDKYYMFYSTEEHIAIAVSDDPKGPFKRYNDSYLRDHKSIDHHLFIDDDGSKYLYFANFKEGLEIWGARLNDDFSIRPESLTKIIEQSQEWEKSPKEPVGTVNEGPFIVKKGGKYYMTYSGNHYASPDYGIGLAYAKSPLGAWTKSPENPVLQNPGENVGSGHSAFFTDKEGQLNIVYHVHNSTQEVHPRKVLVSPASFEKDPDEEWYSLKIDPFFKPEINSAQ